MTRDTMTQEKIVNGVNVDQLFRMIGQIRGKPESAKFKFRATNEWVNGTHNRSTIAGFSCAGEEDTSRKPTVIEMDEPPVILGNNEGANPTEYLLVALSGCLTTSLIANAAAREIELRRVRSRFEGNLDLRGFLGISENAKVGYESIRVYFTIDADISEDEKEELLWLAQEYSVVFNTITESAPVSVRLEK